MRPLSKQTLLTASIPSIAVILLLFFTLWFPYIAFSHGIKITARMDNSMLMVESALAGHRLPPGSEVVIINNHSKKELLKGTSTDKGFFSIQLPADLLAKPVDLLIRVSDRYGHHAKTVVRHEMYEGLALHKQNQVPQSHSHQHIEDQIQKEITLSPETLHKMMDELLEQKLSPVRAQLAALEKDRVSFRDIIGGIGYLVGLAGLATWMRNRK